VQTHQFAQNSHQCLCRILHSHNPPFDSKSVCLGIFHDVGLVKGIMVIALVNWSFVDWWLILQ